VQSDFISSFVHDPSAHFLSLSQHDFLQSSLVQETCSFFAQQDLFIMEQEEMAKRAENVM
jgi:hypothetical protein